MYLPNAAVWTTLQAVASLTRAGGGIVFDYAVPVETLTLIQRAKFAILAGRAAAAGEPFQTFLDPDTLRKNLMAFGFATVRDLGPEALNATYFADRADDLSVGAIGHVLTAWRI